MKEEAESGPHQLHEMKARNSSSNRMSTHAALSSVSVKDLIVVSLLHPFVSLEGKFFFPPLLSFSFLRRWWKRTTGICFVDLENEKRRKTGTFPFFLFVIT